MLVGNVLLEDLCGKHLFGGSAATRPSIPMLTHNKEAVSEHNLQDQTNDRKLSKCYDASRINSKTSQIRH